MRAPTVHIKAGGDQGELIALLPRTWEFRKDPRDVGAVYQWYLPKDTEGWEVIDTTICWDFQGHMDEGGWGYAGKPWYRAQFEVPAEAAGKPLTLTIGAVYNGADYNRSIWIWMNGRMVEWEMARRHRLGYYHHMQEPIHIDVTNDLQPSENATVAVLVHTRPATHTPRGGIHRRAFLWSTRSTPESTAD